MSAASRPGHADLPLPAALRAGARGSYPLEAGVELLIAHASWLHRNDFVAAFLDTDNSIIDGFELASIDWTGAIAALDTGALPCSRSQERILRLAASLGAGLPVDLRDATTGLDPSNTALLSQAIRHATGHQPSPQNH